MQAAGEGAAAGGLVAGLGLSLVGTALLFYYLTHRKMCSMTFTPDPPTVGGSVRIDGHGFEPMESVLVTFTAVGFTHSTGVMTDAQGNFTISAVAIPVLPSGTHLTIKADGSQCSTSQTFVYP